MSRYAIWNKRDRIYTPSGAVFTAEEWMSKYPIARANHVTIVCGGGELNGSFFGTLGSMMERATSEGCDFSGCSTPQEYIAKIEAFENEREATLQLEAKQRADKELELAEMNAMATQSIAAQLEFQNMLTLDDIEE